MNLHLTAKPTSFVSKVVHHVSFDPSFPAVLLHP